MYQGGSVTGHQLLTTKQFIIQQVEEMARNYETSVTTTLLAAICPFIILPLSSECYLNMDGLTAVYLVSIALSLLSRNPPPYYSNVDAFAEFLWWEIMQMHESC